MRKKGITLFAGVAMALAIGGCGQGPETGRTTSIQDVEYEPVEDTRPVILFLGDSLTAGYHLDPDQAFPAHIQRFIDGRHLSYRVVNAGVSGDSSVDGLNRVEWLLKQPVHTLVVALGANDGLRGQPAGFTRDNLRQILQRARATYPDLRLVVAGMRMPANYGEPYRSEFEALFLKVAEEFDAVFIPFLLEDVAGVPELNMADGIHPNAEGHRIMARNVWPYIQSAIARP